MFQWPPYLSTISSTLTLNAMGTQNSRESLRSYFDAICIVPLIGLISMHLPLSCHGQQQKFRVTPHDLQVLEGAEAMLRCEVSNLAGAVQWTKDGFALGFSAVIPGFPRYSVLGDRKQGAYNLRISNASITDDAEYQCQVGPARLNSAIRANAKLTVICK
uniref:Ig-like domain-containing protein n=1 Tax=Glossina palpalis gambiensis TaxID=67801 RepID=A0A1B0BRT3_9MUSC